MVCSSSSTTIDTSYVLQVLSNGDSSKEVVVDHNEGLKPSLEAPVPPYGPDLLKMIQTEEGRAQLNQQQEPLVELLNRKVLQPLCIRSVMMLIWFRHRNSASD